ncbi:hypothetical protein Norbert_43 [Paenibacillus phage Norbert]|uniref:hypothetical protein n=1 Tax=Paenibacillus larvae TaxID=1464 RepID=UPI0003DBA92E|nr:hypothetical protein [Paenibacillus larvae]ETK30378.1 hypothetical protein ERIC1_1c39450 [Paenibacillus larvae subsp. larvae DSM 25719]QVV20038.1 hypothetical protein Norbert_43 [Paenibacillus phage Norbert]QVV20242.1 hypothetical protein Riker_44 [Paenibacillus phage Riker]
MNEPNLASVKRRLEQLKVRLTTLDNYKGWLHVHDEDGNRIYEDLADGELATLIKKQIQKEVKFLKEWLKERENEPKS